MARTAKTKTPKVTKEVSAAIKGFKASSEIENFYKFIHDNGLRNEARTLIQMALSQITGKKKKKVLQ